MKGSSQTTLLALTEAAPASIAARRGASCALHSLRRSVARLWRPCRGRRGSTHIERSCSLKMLNFSSPDAGACRRRSGSDLRQRAVPASCLRHRAVPTPCARSHSQLNRRSDGAPAATCTTYSCMRAGVLACAISAMGLSPKFEIPKRIGVGSSLGVQTPHVSGQSWSAPSAAQTQADEHGNATSTRAHRNAADVGVTD